MKKFTAYLLILILAVTALGCGSNEKNQKKPCDTGTASVRLYEVAHSIFYAPQYCAIELGYFKDEGIDITLNNAKGADNVMTALLSGDADIGFMGSEASIYVYDQGATNYAINFAQLTQRAGNFLVSRKEEPDFTWKNLIGKSVIGGRVGGMPQMVFEYILKQNGIDPENDVDIIQNIDFGSTAPAFAGGTGDYTVEFEPFATSLETEGKGHVVASLGTDSGYVPYTAYCTLGGYLKENKKTIQKFTNAIQKGLDFVNSHTAKEIAAVIQPQFPETDPADLEIIVSRYLEQDTWKEDTIFQKESFELLEDILIDAGQLKKQVPYEKLVTTDFSEDAKH